MLISLEIKNIAVIKDITINFKEGFNVITGETGTGKSIVIDALNFALGDRADKTLIRHGEELSTVQAVFFIKYDKTSDIYNKFLATGIDFNEGNIIIRRSMYLSGRTECRINDVVTSLSILKEISSYLINIHSQHETSHLFDERYHLSYIDKFSTDTLFLKDNYLSLLYEYQTILKELSSLPSLDNLNHEIELLKFQINEIETAGIEIEEESRLIQERKIIQNREKILNSLTNIFDYLGNDLYGIEPSLKKCLKEFSFLLQYDDLYKDCFDRTESILIESKDILSFINDRMSDNLYDSKKADTIDSRIDLIRKIKAKYGKTEEDVLFFLEKSKLMLDRLLNSDKVIENLMQNKHNLRSNLIKAAEELSNHRIKIGKGFSQEILRQLNELGLENSKFTVEFTKDPYEDSNYNFTARGIDSASFFISLNPGEPPKELKKVASGGELSRIMLGIKNITANIDNIPTIVFDEIDTGISGNAAKTIAKKLYDISRGRQIIVITHLAQIAAMGDSNYLITKNIYENETITMINPLDEIGTLNEILRIGGLTKTSQFGMSAAKELLLASKEYKDI